VRARVREQTVTTPAEPGAEGLTAS
jgi:hypothetical protein